jgi:fused signal recognition particle receptor
MSFFKKIFSSEKKETLDKGLENQNNFLSKLSKAVAGKVDDAVLDNLEEILVASDVGLILLKKLFRIESRVAADKYLGIQELNKILQEEISGLLAETNTGEATEFVIKKIKPYVIMVVGVNGVGKTRHRQTRIPI